MKNILTPEQVKIFLDAFEKKIGKKTLLIDMDGVVADFEPMAQFHSDRLGVTFKEL